MADKKKPVKGKTATDKEKEGKGKGDNRPVKVAEEPKEPVLPDGPKTYVVGGWSTLQRIADALVMTDVTTGDKVAVNAGEFHEPLELAKDGLDIKGVGGNDKVVLTRGVWSSATSCTLRQVTIIGSLEVAKGNVTVSEAIIKDGKHGVVIHAIANPTVQNCRILDQQVAGVYAFPNSRGTVENSQILGTGAENTVGIFADQSGTVFRGNEIRRQVTGVTVQGECAGLVLQGNTIADIGGMGVHFTKGARSLCKGNTIETCKYYGLVLEKNASPTLEKNMVSACPVSIKLGCKPVLKLNHFTGKVANENDVGNSRMEPTY